MVDMKLELVAVPVSDVDRAKAFYTEKVGFNADHDHTVSDEIRFVQLTPPGSACSIAIGRGIVEGEPGSVRGLVMVVADVEAAHAELVRRGAEVSDIQDFDWGRFVFFADPEATSGRFSSCHSGGLSIRRCAWRRLGDADLRDRVAGCAVGRLRRLHRRLRVTGLVGGTRLDM